MWKIETHLHTKEGSGCARLWAVEQMQECAKAGYNTVFVTDHYSKPVFDRFPDLSWEEKVQKFLAGYTHAHEAGRELGITVLCGMELTFTCAPNDYLVYGITKEFLEHYPYLYESNIEEFYLLAKKCGLLVIQAHPYRENICYPTPKYVDGIEIYNSNPRHEDYNEKAELLAKQERLLVTSGSDAHRLGDAGLSGMLSDESIQTVEEFIALIKSGKGQIIRG